MCMCVCVCGRFSKLLFVLYLSTLVMSVLYSVFIYVCHVSVGLCV